VHNNLPAVRFGGRWKFFLPSVATWLEQELAEVGPTNESGDQELTVEEAGSQD
jgi:hypothetical protein